MFVYRSSKETNLRFNYGDITHLLFFACLGYTYRQFSKFVSDN